MSRPLPPRIDARAAKRLPAAIALAAVLAGGMVPVGTKGGARAQEIEPPMRERDGTVTLDDRYLDFLAGSTTAASPDRQARRIDAEAPTRQRVRFDTSEPAGAILIDSAARRLYLVQRDGSALSYLVGVGREGFGWRGTQVISAKRRWPDWRPPADMLARRPDLPRHMPGGINNPLGAGALYLGDTLYRIHGSNEPETVGTDASSGCFRMRNADLVDLYERVAVGARVTVF